MKKVWVVIPTYNSWDTLKSCIASIQNQTVKPGEIIVVNNGSTDQTSGKVKEKFPAIKLIDLKINTGVTGGRNTGIKNANRFYDYLLFFDHDMVADQNMISELIKVAQTDPKIGIVTPKIYYWVDKKRIWSAGTSINLWSGQIIFRGGQDSGQYDKQEEIQVAPAAMLVKKDVIRKLKKFDDTYFATYEDTDFCFRARHAGFKTYYAPQAKAYHKLPTDFEEESKRLLSRSYWVGRNRVIFMKKYGKNFFIFLLFLPLYSLYYLLLSIRCRQILNWFKFLQGTLVGIIH